MEKRWINRLAATLPHGGLLDAATWERYHERILVLLGLHAVTIPLFGLLMGNNLVRSLAAGLLLLVIVWAAKSHRISRRFRSAIGTLGLMTSSALLVHLSGGYIEAHFHFFVMLAVIALYFDWIPFMTAMLLVVIDHGVIGTIAPMLTYNHPMAQHHQWIWALVHGGFILAESAALLVYWKVNERAQEKSKESEARLRQLIDAAPDALIVIDGKGRIVLVNRQAESLFGYARAEFCGQPLEILLPEGVRQAYAQHRTAYFANPCAWPMGRGCELVVRRKDGSEVKVEGSVSPLKTGEGTFAIAAVRDITERTWIEAQANAYAKELVQKNSELDIALGKAEAATQAKSSFLTTGRGDEPASVDLVKAADLQEFDGIGDPVTTRSTHSPDETPQHWAVMQVASRKLQMAILAETDPTLKGSSSNFDVGPTQQISVGSEAIGHDGEWPQAGDLLARLEADLVLVQAALVREQGRGTSPLQSEK